MLKKFIVHMPALVFASAVTFSGCTEETPAPVVVTQENNVPDGTSIITYSVHVVGSSDPAAKIAGVSGASVTISQGGALSTVITDESGIAVFPSMREGMVSLYIKKDGYLAVNRAEFISSTIDNHVVLDSEQHEFDQVQVELPKSGAVLRGTIYGNFDFDSQTLDMPVPQGVTVIASASPEYQPNVWTTTTDNQGTFSFTGLPENVELRLGMNYQTMNNLVSPSYEKDWMIPDVFDGPYTLSIYDNTALGIIIAQ